MRLELSLTQLASLRRAHSILSRQVVRCSQRIVAGAASFQLGEHRRETKSMHAASGPPLKSYLFDLAADDSPEMRQQRYTEKVMEAFGAVIKELPGLDLHDRLAFIVSNGEMVKGLKPDLEQALAKGYPRRNFVLVDAQTASASMGNKKSGQIEWLVLDEMAHFDGLERLIVICIGLDSKLEDPNGDVRETRSMLYRGLTRAHMSV
jgi:hypothetical protein